MNGRLLKEVLGEVGLEIPPGLFLADGIDVREDQYRERAGGEGDGTDVVLLYDLDEPAGDRGRETEEGVR